MRPQSIHNQIEEKIKSLKKGSILFTSDFLELGTAENVKKVLLRLEKKEVLIRLAHGIYLYPKLDKVLGRLFPSTEDIALAIRANALKLKNHIVINNFTGLLDCCLKKDDVC